MPIILITGANRGIGLELTRQFVDDGWKVHACCRRPDDAGELETLRDSAEGRLHLHRLDVMEPEQIHALADALRDEPIDILLNNAGVFLDKGSTFGRVDPDEWIDSFRINTIAPFRMAEAFVDNVARSQRKIIATMTSRMGSIDDNTSGGHYAYRSSKAAVNMVNRSMAVDLRQRGITTLVVHPGWVRTSMGGASAPLTVEQSAEGLRQVLTTVGPADTGKFLGFDGGEIPW